MKEFVAIRAKRYASLMDDERNKKQKEQKGVY